MRPAALLVAVSALALAQAPEDVRLEIGFPDGRDTFRMGEPVRIELRFSSSAEGKYGVRTEAVPLSETFSFEPRDHVRYPLEDCFWPGGVAFSILSGSMPLRPEPVAITLDLTQTYRFRPGRYRVSVTTTRVYREQHEGEPLRISGGPAEFTIEPPDPSWQTQRLHQLAAVLDGDGGRFTKQQAAQELSNLTTRAAVDEMARRLAEPSGDFDWFWREGLCSAPDQSGAIGQMQAVLALPETSIRLDFLYMLASLRMGGGTGETRDKFIRHAELVTEAAGELAAVVPKKTAEARLAALGTLAAVKTPPPEAMMQVAEHFDELSAAQQYDLLVMHWENVRSPMMIPVLLRILKSRPSPATPWLRTSALQHLYELDPLEGEKRAIAEMRDSGSTVPARDLGFLRQDTLPALDRTLLARVESGEYSSRARAAALIARYATAAIYGEVRQVFEQKPDTDACDIEHPLLAYFVRVKPEEGVRLIERELAARKNTVCGGSMIFRIAGFRWSPALENLAIAHLADGGEVSGYAAWTLAEYGSEEAEPALWKALADFSSAWKDHAQDIPGAERFCEERLASALLHGKRWTLDPAEKARIVELCVTDSCRSQ